MNILSIDVGIKNLAYCLFFIQPNKQYEIMQWHTVNLVETRKICSEQKKNLKKFFKNYKYYCKIKAKKKKFKIPTNNLKPSNIKKLKIAELKQICNKFELIYNKKAKKKDYIELLDNYIDKNYFSFVNTINSKDVSIVSLGIKMKHKLDILLKDIPIHHVIIENQISPIANRMKTLQCMIIQHFIEKGITNIKEISAANKLKEFLGKHQKTSYNDRKKLGKKHCAEIICTNPYLNKWDTFFLSHKKKDDLADCFLQGWWYIRTNNII